MPGGTARNKLSEDEESFLLIEALRDANLPRFLAEDVPLFEAIMADLFPGVEAPPLEYPLIEVRGFCRKTFGFRVPLRFCFLSLIAEHGCVRNN